MMKDLIHSGVAHDENPPGRGSGRYGWGTGSNPHQHQFDIESEVRKMSEKGYPKSEIAKIILGPKGYKNDGTPIWPSATDLKAAETIEKNRKKQINMETAAKLLEKYNNVSAVAREMGRNESTIRGWLDPVAKNRSNKYVNTANFLREKVEEKGMIDVGKSTEITMGVTEHTKQVAISMLEQEGYLKVKLNIPQVGKRDQNTTTIALVKPLEGESPKDTFIRAQQNKLNINTIDDYSSDGGITWWKPEFPESMSSKNVMIRYKEDGGAEKDGVIEINPDAKYLSLEGSRYAQVRIAVDGTNYMKGMAIYGLKDDFPEGIDVIYNTNKKKGTPAIDTNAVYDPETDNWSGKEVLKRMKVNRETGEVDINNPFGATIKAPKEVDGVVTRAGQHKYIDSDGNEKLSPVNKVREEGEWDSWSRNLSSQFLSKQPIKLINQQINLSLAKKKIELDKIKELTNPVIKKKLLEDYAGDCDANAVDLSVKGFKNQAFQVLLPVPSMKDNEIYAPKFKDGDTVALVRYPHAGIFEIPILTVNNKHPKAKQVLGDAADAVGVNSNVAEKLSGADFDGDTVVTIPLKSNRLNVQAAPSLKGFENWDPKELYKLPDSAPKMKNDTKQKQMGIITNLIADMTAQAATDSEMVRAVKHSMVVIDAEKHHLDYKKSALDNDIKALKDHYQKRIDPETGKETTGASTIFSRAKNPTYVNKRKEVTDTNKMTSDELKRWNEGKKVWRDTGEYVRKRITDPEEMTPDELTLYRAGKKVYRDTNEHVQVRMKRMEIVDDARTLIRDPSNLKEVAYADYANELKNLANEARKEARFIKPYEVSAEARNTYAEEVASLDQKLRVSQSNRPRERKAQAVANILISERLKSNPDTDNEHKKRVEAQCLAEARALIGAKRQLVEITDREWEAIQAKAISSTKLADILLNTDQDAFKKRATPKGENKAVSEGQISLIRAMSESGMYTQSDIAEATGVSTSFVSQLLRNQRIN